MCPRCEAVLALDEGSIAAFCSHCGLPQLRVSAELIADAEKPAFADRRNPASKMPIDWPVMLRFCALTAVGEVFFSFLLPGAVTAGAGASVALFSLPLLALATGSLYLMRHSSRTMNARVGARMGAVNTLFVVAGVDAVSAIASFVLRYRYHSPALEQAVNLQMQQYEAQVRTVASAADSGPILAVLQKPEWHAGMFLCEQLLGALLLIVAGSLFGALVGALLGARQQRNRNSA